MKVVIIGGTGHVGTYLTPRLVEAGHDVVCITRGTSKPYLPHAAWDKVQMITLDREKAEAAGTFGAQVASYEPDIVIDMICFTVPSAQHIVEALRGKVQHYLFCGTIWMHGHTTVIPTTEDAPREPFGDYGIQKSDIERYLMREARLNGFPVTALHPGHIMGPGHEPVSPVGNRDLAVWSKLAKGEAVALPNIGMETLHHVHGDDVAQLFMLAIANRSVALGESFHAVSDGAVTLRGFAEVAASWFGQTANLTFMPFDEWKHTTTPQLAADTWDHIAHSPCASIEKARRMLGYTPRYSALQSVYESVQWLVDNGKIDV